MGRLGNELKGCGGSGENYVAIKPLNTPFGKFSSDCRSELLPSRSLRWITGDWDKGTLSLHELESTSNLLSHFGSVLGL